MIDRKIPVSEKQIYGLFDVAELPVNGLLFTYLLRNITFTYI